jgi:hypothetical protein
VLLAALTGHAESRSHAAQDFRPPIAA